MKRAQIKSLKRCLGLRWIMTGCVISWFTACGVRFPEPPHFKADPARYHAQLQERSESIKSLSGELAVELWEDGKRVAIRQLFASRPPRHLRIDTLTPFEQPLATLIYNEQLLAIHNQEQARFAVGSASAGNFERLTRVRIKPTEMSALLSGQVPRLLTRGGMIKWDPERGRTKLTLERGDERQVISFDESKLTPRVVEMYRQGELIVRLSLAQYTDREPYLPQRLRFEMPHRKIRVEIELKDFTLNPDLPEIAFEIKAPPGLSVSDL